MTSFGECVGTVAPYYNLVLVLVVLLLFLKLFSIPNKKIFLLPWKFLFIAVIIYILEELLVVFGYSGIIQIPRIWNAFFEFIIITLFIYALLLQRQHVNDHAK
jgi:hypothetical protein